jgi:hypothetical protein
VSVISILRPADNDWQVWINLDDGTKAPAGLSFCIGGGETRDEAIADAVEDLEDAIAQCREGQS